MRRTPYGNSCDLYDDLKRDKYNLCINIFPHIAMWGLFSLRVSYKISGHCMETAANYDGLKRDRYNLRINNLSPHKAYAVWGDFFGMSKDQTVVVGRSLSVLCVMGGFSELIPLAIALPWTKELII